MQFKCPLRDETAHGGGDFSDPMRGHEDQTLPSARSVSEVGVSAPRRSRMAREARGSGPVTRTANAANKAHRNGEKRLTARK